MIHRISKRCALKLSKAKLIDTAELDVYCYGFEQIISTTAIIVTILIAAVLTGDAVKSLLFIVCFVPIRIFAGGFHCSTYRGCFLFSNGIFLLSLFLGKMEDGIFPVAAAFINAAILLLCCIIVYQVAPVLNPNNPLSGSEIIRNKRCARFVILVQAFVIIIAYFVAHTNMMYYNFSTISTGLSICLTVIAWIQLRKGGNQ